jgi:hypothetical protein
LTGKTVNEYFKIGGRGKASLLELYEFFVHLSKEETWELPWKKLAKIVC